jgi:thiol-disulfide isomerase/thioredoxin
MKSFVTVATIKSFEQYVDRAPKTLVVVYASWCGFCKMYLPIVDEAKLALPVYLIESEVFKKYGGELTLKASVYPTSFIIENGKVLETKEGVVNLQALHAMCD